MRQRDIVDELIEMGWEVEDFSELLSAVII